MIETIVFLGPAILICVLFAGMFSYFGNHILTRGIIFIDIAIAQIAALGTMIGLNVSRLLYDNPETAIVPFVALAFTVVVISIFALTKFEKQVIPQEAIIGIIYGLSLGVAMLLAEKTPGGSNFISKTISGNIMWVNYSQVGWCLLLFSGIGGIHFFLQKQFLKISESKENLPYSIGKVRMFELIFYITFAVAVVYAVPIGGIFLVFVLLIAPTAIATLFTAKWSYRFIFSWLIGIVGSFGGIYISYTFDIANAPSIVTLLGVMVFVLVFVWIFMNRSKEGAPISEGGK